MAKKKESRKKNAFVRVDGYYVLHIVPYTSGAGNGT